jgi:hypothetical protein
MRDWILAEAGDEMALHVPAHLLPMGLAPTRVVMNRETLSISFGDEIIVLEDVPPRVFPFLLRPEGILLAAGNGDERAWVIRAVSE